MNGAVKQATMALEQAHTAGVYPKRPVVITRGQGARVWDEEGREYIDATSGQGVALLGHAHPAVARAIAEQAQTLITCPEIFFNDRRAQFLERLTSLAPAGLTRAFLCNSGAEAVEAALKFARLATGRKGIVATIRGFHGRTMGALSATWEPKYREPFQPLIPGFTHIPYDNLETAEKAIGPETAAVIVEAVQGEGGVRPASPGYLSGLRRLCDERGALLILDEIQTGLGRTGRWFACQHTGVVPDLMALAKGLAGGVPMGAVLIGPRVGSLPPMSHGSTFGGNPLACAAALATLDVLEKEKLPEQAAEKGEYLLGRLRRIEADKVREVRGIGLMIGVELRERVTPYLMALMRLGVLALPAGPTVLRLLPPLVISYDEMDRLTAAVEHVLTHEEVLNKDGSEGG